MNDILKMLKSFKFDKKTVTLLILGVIAVLFLVLGTFAEGNENSEVNITDTSAYSAQYIKKSETDLEKIINKINGAGKTEVLITLESCYENVYAKSVEQKSDTSQEKDSVDYKEQYAIVKKGSQNEDCLIIKVYEPTVKGVAVVCEGGDSATVKKAITETICALFDVSTDKVSVVKMS